MQRLAEGHYRDSSGIEYMSIWTYKRINGFANYFNTPESNSKEALEFKNKCPRKSWQQFTQSDRFKEGYVYDVKCLDEYYTDKPKRLSFGKTTG